MMMMMIQINKESDRYFRCKIMCTMPFNLWILVRYSIIIKSFKRYAIILTSCTTYNVLEDSPLVHYDYQEIL